MCKLLMKKTMLIHLGNSVGEFTCTAITVYCNLGIQIFWICLIRFHQSTISKTICYSNNFDYSKIQEFVSVLQIQLFL